MAGATAAPTDVVVSDPIGDLKAVIGDVIVRPWSEAVVRKISFRTSLHLPDGSKPMSEAWIGEVVSVGPPALHKSGKFHIPATVKLGDCVLYRKWGGALIEWGKEQRRRLNPDQDEVLAILSHPDGSMYREEEFLK